MKILLLVLFISTNSFSQENISSVKDKVLSYKNKITEINSMQKKVPVGRVTIKHENGINSDYSLVNLRYFLDGEELMLNQKKDSFIVYDDYVVPREHKLIVQAVYAGDRTGIFNYLNDYRIKVNKVFNFNSIQGVYSNITIKTFKKGIFFTSFKNRPDIKIEIKKKQL